MSDTTSDWQTLFDKCAHDADYRARLATALAQQSDGPIVELLSEISVARGNVAARVSALRAARDPMLALADEFDVPSSVAP